MKRLVFGGSIGLGFWCKRKAKYQKCNLKIEEWIMILKGQPITTKQT